MSTHRIVARGQLFRIMLWISGLNSRFFASTCAASEGSDRWKAHAFLPAWLHQNEQPKPCSEVFIASIVCLHVPSMVDFADGFLAISSHILRV